MTNPQPSEYELVGNLNVLPTPAGAYYAVSTPDDTHLRRLIFALLRRPSSRHVDTDKLCRWLDTNDEQKALDVVFQAQTLAFIE